MSRKLVSREHMFCVRKKNEFEEESFFLVNCLRGGYINLAQGVTRSFIFYTLLLLNTHTRVYVTV